MANDRLTVGHAGPLDLVSGREAAQAVGITAQALHSCIQKGRLSAETAPHGRRVSLAAVRALYPPSDPQAPTDALLVAVAALETRVPKGRIRIWAREGLLPSWRSHHGLLVRPADVRAVAQLRGMLLPSDESGGVAR